MGKTRGLFHLPKVFYLLVNALFTFSRLSHDYFIFSSLILDRFLKSAVSFTYRKFSMGQISQQGKVPDMAEGNCWDRLVIPVMQHLLNMFHKDM